MTDNAILIIAIGMIGLGAGSFWLFITLVISESWLKNRAKAKRERKEAQQEEE